MRNFNPIMATAGNVVIAEVEQIVAVDELPLEEIHTPGIFVDHLVQVDRHPGLFDPPKKGSAK